VGYRLQELPHGIGSGVGVPEAYPGQELWHGDEAVLGVVVSPVVLGLAGEGTRLESLDFAG